MFVGQVAGEIVSTINHPAYDNRRLLVIDRLNLAGSATGGYLIAVATVDAGVGQKVLVVDEGTGARQILGDAEAPIRSVVVGVVDAVNLSHG